MRWCSVFCEEVAVSLVVWITVFSVLAEWGRLFLDARLQMKKYKYRFYYASVFFFFFDSTLKSTHMRKKKREEKNSKKCRASRSLFFDITSPQSSMEHEKKKVESRDSKKVESLQKRTNSALAIVLWIENRSIIFFWFFPIEDM